MTASGRKQSLGT